MTITKILSGDSIRKIPKVFYDDHVARDLPSPTILHETKRHYWIDRDHPDTPELLNDARHYSDCAGFGWNMGSQGLGLQQSARATVNAISK